MFEPEQVGALAPENRPQSSTLRSSWPSSPSVSTLIEVESVKVPETLPELAMSTMPFTFSPGFMFGALNSALDALLPIVRVPAVRGFDGFAACAVKFAPEPTVMPTAARTTASAPMVRRGCAARADRRDTGTASVEGIWGHGPASPRWLGPLRPYSRGVPGHTVHVGMPGADLEAPERPLTVFLPSRRRRAFAATRRRRPIGRSARLGLRRRRLGLPVDRTAEAGRLQDLQRQQRALHARRRDVDPEQVEDERAVELQQVRHL